MKKLLLPKIKPFNPNVLQPSLNDTADDIENQKLELEVMKLHSSVPDDHPEEYPYKIIDGIAIAHPCICFFDDEIDDFSMGTAEEADEQAATSFGYHKSSNSTALIMTTFDETIIGIILYGADGARRLHSPTHRFFKYMKLLKNT